MIYLFNAAFPTLGIMLYEIFYCKNKKNPLFYVSVFLLLSIFHYTYDYFSFSLHSYEKKIKCSLTQDQRDHYWELIHKHYYSGYRCMGMANEYTHLLPDPEKILSQTAITATGAAILTRDIKAIAVAASAEAIREILTNFKETWKKMESYVYAAQYHVEMAEFYQNVLASDGG